MKFEKIAKESLSEKTANQLLGMIKGRNLKPGDKLPPERDLSLEMNISRPVLREALRALSLMNIVEIRQGDGIYITSLKSELLVEHLDFVFSLTDSSFLTLFEARRLLETGMIEIAASKLTNEELDQIEDCTKQSILQINDYDLFSFYDLELHRIISESVGNPILNQMIKVIFSLSKESRNRTVRLEGVIEQTIIDHQKILDALKKRDPIAARHYMLEHLNNVERRLKQQLDDASI